MSTWLDRALALGRAQPADPSPRFVPVSPMAAGVPVTQDSALTLATVFACVRAIAEDIAGLPWQGLRRNGERREPTDDMDALLNVSASEEVSAFDFRAALLSHALTWGTGYAEIVRNGKGQARELVLLTPERVDPRRDAMGRLVYEVAQPNSGERVTIPAADMFHVRGLSRDGIRGYSVVAQAAMTLGINLAQDSFAASFYGNGAHPGLAVTVPMKMSAEAMKSLLDRLKKLVGGPRRAFNPLVLDDGSKIERVTVPPNEAQFLESRQFGVEEICRWFRVPPHKVGHLERATFSNIEHQGLDYVTSALLPWCRRLETEADRKLCFGYVGDRTKLNLAALMRGDSTARSNFYTRMRQLGAFSVNEIRAFEDMNPIGADGDVYVMQSQFVPLEKLGEDPKPAPAPQAPDPAADPTGNQPQE